MFEQFKHWILEEGPWWTCSFVFHVVIVCSLALIGNKVMEKIVDEAPSFEEAKVDKSIEVPQEIERFEVGQTPEDPTELSPETLMLEKPAEISQEAKYYDDSGVFTERGDMALASTQPNLGGFDIKGIGAGPAVKGKGDVGIGAGTHAGGSGDNWGFGGRVAGSRKAMLGSGGGTKQSERAVAGALNWIARHQLPNGSWSFAEYTTRCKDKSCAEGEYDEKDEKAEGHVGDRPAAATAMALLPFFGSGLTHETKGTYKKSIYAGVSYLINKQKPDGDLRMGGSMYDHGLASIALCECYGMSNDKRVGKAAQEALNFIEKSQDPVGGGWRYTPKQSPGDTSVAGWQIMALKSGQMAYLEVNPGVLDRAKKFLKSASSGISGKIGGGRFAYLPNGDPTLALTAVGLLCCQYMGVARNDPAMVDGTSVIMGNLPDINGRNMYYWYYATQVMHNQPGPEWDTWNRKMRRTLIDTQCKDDNCAAGSWSPREPKTDSTGMRAGRLYMTSLSALTLEVYYRYLPLYKLNKGSNGGEETEHAEKTGKEKTEKAGKAAKYVK